ncbi:MAG: GNAT family N-acetyltransferase [Candidatus Methanofastidiosia archaeon]|jgi:ribosomal protein S18 acetylase RimI-like enzyme
MLLRDGIINEKKTRGTERKKMTIREIKISIQKWNEVDVHELAQLAIIAWQAKGSTLSIERLINWLNRLEFRFSPMVVLAHSENNLIGWLLFYIQSSTEAKINPWALNGHPIVLPDNKEMEIAAKLIEQSISFAKKEGLTRLEIDYDAEEKKVNQRYKAFYESLGMSLIEENVHMRTDISKHERAWEAEFSSGSEINPIMKVDEEEFFQCFYQTFQNSEDRWLSDKSDDEIRDCFNDLIYDNPFPLIENASIAIIKTKKVIAFTVVRKSHGENNGQIWVMGVHPKYRRRGIGKNLIHFIKKKLAEQGLQTMSLNVDLANNPAYQLYEKQGFKPEWCKLNHAWKADDYR